MTIPTEGTCKETVAIDPDIVEYVDLVTRIYVGDNTVYRLSTWKRFLDLERKFKDVENCCAQGVRKTSLDKEKAAGQSGRIDEQTSQINQFFSGRRERI